MKIVFPVVLLGLSAAAVLGADRVGSSAAPASAEDFLRVIRNNDLKSLKDMSRTGVADVRDRLDWTPLHYAALYGSVDSVRVLLAAGADPNARNKSDNTPLMFAAYNLDKTRLLVEKGGNVNAKATDATTALWVAAGAHGNRATVEYLAGKGADLKAGGPNKADLLMRAATHQDAATVRFLLDRGLDPHAINDNGTNALWASVGCDGGEKARLLIDAGSDVNVVNKSGGSVKNGPIDLTSLTSLMFAATCGETQTIRALLKAGAKVNALDGRKMNALMMAIASDEANPECVRILLEAGSDLNQADRYGDTALDWARRYRNPAILSMLEKAGAREKGLSAAPVRPADYHPDARAAIAKSSTLLAKSADTFFVEGGGCVGCHHQPFAARAFGAAKSAGVSTDKRMRLALIEAQLPEKARRMGRLPLLNMGGGGFDTFLYALLGLSEMGEPATMLTDTEVHFIAANQDASGGWIASGNRAPLQQSDITRTMLAINTLKSYSWPAREQEFRERIARARTWLENAHPHTTVEVADRLMGLCLAGAPESQLRSAAEPLLRAQRADGGWAQTPNLESDAYGTAAALHTLRKSGVLKTSDAAYQKGTRYLLDTQFPDGSWYVRSRAVKLQPYFQAAFPYDHDQWISNSATAYAVMALAPVVK